MNFDPDLTKQAQEASFSRKTKKTIHPKSCSNIILVSKAGCQKHLGIHLDSKSSFEIHTKTILRKVNKTIDSLQKDQKVFPRPFLITIYKAFIRPHLDYGDVVLDQAFNNSFHKRL